MFNPSIEVYSEDGVVIDFLGFILKTIIIFSSGLSYIVQFLSVNSVSSKSQAYLQSK